MPYVFRSVFTVWRLITSSFSTCTLPSMPMWHFITILHVCLIQRCPFRLFTLYVSRQKLIYTPSSTRHGLFTYTFQWYVYQNMKFPICGDITYSTSCICWGSNLPALFRLFKLQNNFGSSVISSSPGEAYWTSVFSINPISVCIIFIGLINIFRHLLYLGVEVGR